MSKTEKQRRWGDMMKLHQKRLLVKDWDKLADKIGYWVLAIATAVALLIGLYKILFI